MTLPFSFRRVLGQRCALAGHSPRGHAEQVANLLQFHIPVAFGWGHKSPFTGFIPAVSGEGRLHTAIGPWQAEPSLVQVFLQPL